MNQYESHLRRLPNATEYTENIARIKELDERISTLKRELDFLEVERATRRSFTAAFRRLPAELLAEIASECIKIGESPQRLNQVSRSMREVVNGTKRFWTSIYLLDDVVRIEDYYKGFIRCNNQRYLQLVLERALPMPLIIKIFDPSRVIDLIHKLAPISGSIHTLNLYIFKDAGPGLPVLKLTGLRGLVLTTEEDYTFDTSWIRENLAFTPSGLTKLDLRTSSNNLRAILGQTVTLNASDICLDICDSDDESNAIILPQVQNLSISSDTLLLQRIVAKKLRYLQFEDRNSEGLIAQRIPGCETLESLEIQRSNFRTVDQDPCHFPKLMMMSLTSVVPSLSRAMIAPQLKELTLIATPPSSGNLWDIISGQGMFGPFSLKKLTLGEMDLDERIPSTPAVQPLLRELRVEYCRLSRRFLKWLANGDGRSSVTLPSLKEIHFVGCDIIDEGYSLKDIIAELAENCPEVTVFIGPV